MKQISVSYGFYLSPSLDSCVCMHYGEAKKTRSVESKTVWPNACFTCDCVYVCDSVCSIHTENDYYGSYCIINERTSKQASKRTNIIQIQRDTREQYEIFMH